jgi:hypothetical protein
MKTNNWMKTALVSLLSATMFLTACKKDMSNGSSTTTGISASTGNGISTQMPAYYDAKLFTISFMELSPQAEKSALASNTQFNIIYQYDPGLPGGQSFISVIDAVPHDGFNPF